MYYEIMLRKIIVLILGLLIITLFINRVQVKNFYYEQTKEPTPAAVSLGEIDNLTEVDMVSQQNEEKIPSEFDLSVPFMVQAPDADWNLPYQEACEEAAIIMLHYYWQEKELSKESARQEILDLVMWQNENKGDYKDTTLAQTAQIVEEYWGYKTEIIDNPTPEVIKKQIARGHPVIAPFYGQAIGNPFYSGDGPLYHMMVIKGYTEDKFITNDPGTKRGKDYIYDIDKLMSAIHDWNDGDVQSGQASILIVK